MNPAPQSHTAGPQPRRRARRGLRALLATAAAAGALVAFSAAPALAEYANITVQATRAHAEWLAYVPAPPGAGSVCLVDTGVDLNPDTSAAVVAQLPLDGQAPGDTGATHHGTLMTSIMAAPHNGWGMVGIWPALKVVDVRALAPGANTFTYTNYQRAIARCRVQAGVSVINLSLGGDPARVTDEERAQLENRVIEAHSAGVNVVAAAGNTPGPVRTPGDYGSIFTVAAGDAGGVLCDFASRGPQVDLAAPGCGLDQAFIDGGPAIEGSGSSQAAALTSAVIAALRSYKPSLTVADAEAALTSTADPIAGGYLQLNVEAAFRSVGLGSVVDDAKARQAQAGLPAYEPIGGGAGGLGGGGGGPAASPKPDAPSGGSQQPLPAPAVAPVAPSADAAIVAPDSQLVTPKAAKLTEGRLGTRLTLTNRPQGVMAMVSIYATRSGKASAAKKIPVVVKRLRGQSSRWLFDVPRWTRLEVRYRDGLSTDSEVLTIRAPKKHAGARKAAAKKAASSKTSRRKATRR